MAHSCFRLVYLFKKKKKSQSFLDIVFNQHIPNGIYERNKNRIPTPKKVIISVVKADVEIEYFNSKI